MRWKNWLVCMLCICCLCACSSKGIGTSEGMESGKDVSDISNSESVTTEAPDSMGTDLTEAPAPTEEPEATIPPFVPQKKFVLVSKEFISVYPIISLFGSQTYKYVEYNQYGDEISVEWVMAYSDGTQESDSYTCDNEYEWDEYGNVTKRKVYLVSERRSLVENDIYTYTYDEEGNLIKVVEDDRSYDKKQVTYEFQNGLLVHKLYVTEIQTGDFQYEYEEGKLVKETLIVDGELEQIQEYGEYEQCSISTLYYPNSTTVIDLNLKYEYYEDGKIKTIESVSSLNGARSIYHYDENQNLVLHEAWADDGLKSYEEIYTYEEIEVDKNIWNRRLEPPFWGD